MNLKIYSLLLSILVSFGCFGMEAPKKVTWGDINNIDNLLDFVQDKIRLIEQDLKENLTESMSHLATRLPKIMIEQEIDEFTDLAPEPITTTPQQFNGHLVKAKKIISDLSKEEIESYEKRIETAIDQLNTLKDTLNLKDLCIKDKKQTIGDKIEERICQAIPNARFDKEYTLYHFLGLNTADQGVNNSVEGLQKKFDEQIKKETDSAKISQLRQLSYLLFNPFGKKLYDSYIKNEPLEGYALHNMNTKEIGSIIEKVLEYKAELDSVKKQFNRAKTNVNNPKQSALLEQQGDLLSLKKKISKNHVTPHLAMLEKAHDAYQDIATKTRKTVERIVEAQLKEIDVDDTPVRRLINDIQNKCSELDVVGINNTPQPPQNLQGSFVLIPSDKDKMDASNIHLQPIDTELIKKVKNMEYGSATEIDTAIKKLQATLSNLRNRKKAIAQQCKNSDILQSEIVQYKAILLERIKYLEEYKKNLIENLKEKKEIEELSQTLPNPNSNNKSPSSDKQEQKNIPPENNASDVSHRTTSNNTFYKQALINSIYEQFITNFKNASNINTKRDVLKNTLHTEKPCNAIILYSPPLRPSQTTLGSLLQKKQVFLPSRMTRYPGMW